MPGQIFFATAVLAAVFMLGGARISLGQPAPSAPTASEKPAASPSPSPSPSASPAPSPTPFKLISLSGYGDAGFTSVGGTNAARFVNGTASRVFDVSTGPFFDANGGRQLGPADDFNATPDLQNATLNLVLNGSVLSAHFQGVFGTDANVIASNGFARGGVTLNQGWAQVVQGPLTAVVGKYVTLAGAEVIDTTNGDTNYTHSYLFGYAIPFTHTGVRFSYAATSKVSVIAGVNNGWDDVKFVGKKKTLEGGLAITPSSGYSLALQTYNGNDFAINGSSAAGTPPVYTNRILYDGVLTVHPTSALTLIANYDNGTQLASGTGVFPTAHWNGIAGYANYQFSPLYGLSLRKETFRDNQGFRTGIAQRVQSNTATVNYTPGSNYIFRIEYRLDGSDGPNFSYRGFKPASDLGRNHQSSFEFESIVKFP